jgi:dihydrofolate reductase
MQPESRLVTQERTMRTITYGGAVSLDGFLTAADGAIDWLHFSKDVTEVMADYWKDVDTILMGRKTYLAAIELTGGVRKKASSRRPPKPPKIKTYVFSRTLNPDAELGVQIVTSDAATFVRDLKAQPGKNICLMGGGELAQSLLAAGLVDEVGLNIHPILLGAGVPVFRNSGQRVMLRLVQCRSMDGGCILATYKVVHEQANLTP